MPLLRRGRFNPLSCGLCLLLISFLPVSGHGRPLTVYDGSSQKMKRSNLSGPAQVQQLRCWSSGDYSRVVIYLDRPAPYTFTPFPTTENAPMPGFIHIDFDQSRPGPDVRRHSTVHDELLKGIRISEGAGSRVRVELEVQSVESYRVFPLADPFRVVIDVRRKTLAPAVPPAAPPAQPPPRSKAPSAVAKLSPPPRVKGKSPSLAQQLGLGVRRIVLDPGHGGKDTGAIGTTGAYEKDINLAIARRLQKLLQERTDCKVVLTRNSDRFISLEERTAIANTQKADLFISIHSNSSKDKSSTGIETYFLGFAKDGDAAKVAARENATSEKSVSDLGPILKEILRNSKIAESSQLASVVQEHILKKLKACFNGVCSRGVKQAPFYVLLGTEIPSVLIETGFVSNEREERLLGDESYESALVQGIAEGVLSYMSSLDPGVKPSS
jgi:N-acetylmuramoyl-L-alanine amidase